MTVIISQPLEFLNCNFHGTSSEHDLVTVTDAEDYNMRCFIVNAMGGRLEKRMQPLLQQVPARIQFG
ncbi:MAG: hypothetical protein MZV64_24315 [Ignavibacteriales bacterium]|nr:hypothetical protein [Ignavibacteriales bacterium]